MTEPKLADYALIGNSRSAALVCKTGSIDWCCLPEFHSPGIFAALLDRKNGGYFSITPVTPYRSSQQYLPYTNVVETHFKTDTGEVRIIDAFTAMTDEEKGKRLFPDHEILRIVEGISGTVKMRTDYAPRIFYGKYCPVLEDHQKLGFHFLWKEHILILGTTLASDQVKIVKEQGAASGEFSVASGRQVIFSLSYSGQSPAVIPDLMTARKRLDSTIRYWKDWSGRSRYSGLYHEQVKRSALVLKLLAHAPSGAIIAAPTTSLPEKIGGERNWDYRYCWLRDASFTTRVLVKLGYEDEAHAYMNWILHATQLTRPKLQVVYSVFGHDHVKEETLDWLTGYADSKPVRTGNGADAQFQLDVYGEVLDAVYTYSPLVKTFDRNSRKFILGLGDVICKVWNQPDNGIWEVRSSCVHHTHSKVLAWAGLDRLIKLCEIYQWNEAPVDKFKKTASLILNEVEKFGYNAEMNSYTREFNGTHLDASLLTLSLVGYCDPSSARMSSTIQQITDRLSKNNLIYRYVNVDDGLAGEEGSFAVCNFWLAENLAKAGRLQEAMHVFDTVLKHASPAGLLSEEIDTGSGELLGNYPQGFTHIGLINAALSINEEYEKGKRI
jgi:GH15 family glucan-1,4-alpha-glucosidase